MNRLHAVLDTKLAGKLRFRLQQTQLAGAGDSFGAPLDLEFVKDNPIVPFNSTQGQEKPRANLTIRESLGNELEYFYLTCAQRLDQGLGRRGRGQISFVRARLCLSFNGSKGSQQLPDIVGHNSLRGSGGQ